MLLMCLYINPSRRISIGSFVIVRSIVSNPSVSNIITMYFIELMRPMNFVGISKFKVSHSQFGVRIPDNLIDIVRFHVK